MRAKLSEANRKSTESIKEINRLKHQINKGTGINGTSNITDVIVDEDNNIRRSNGNDERLIDDFVDFKKSVTLDFQNINQKIANLNMKDQYPQGNTLNEQQEEWKEANNSSKINRPSTKSYQKIASRNKFQPIYTEPLDFKEGDTYTIDKHINNLATQNARRSYPVVNKYPTRDLLHHKIKNGTTSIVPGNTDFNNTEKRIL